MPRAFKEAFGGDERQFELGVNIAVLFGIDAIKFFSAVLAILLCSGRLPPRLSAATSRRFCPARSIAGNSIWASGWA